MRCNRWAATAAMALLAGLILTGNAKGQDHESFAGKKDIRHVLLISVDGMHAVDFLNCSKGLAGVNGGQPYCPNLAELGETGVNYLDTSTSVRSTHPLLPQAMVFPPAPAPPAQRQSVRGLSTKKELVSIRPSSTALVPAALMAAAHP